MMDKSAYGVIGGIVYKKATHSYAIHNFVCMNRMILRTIIVSSKSMRQSVQSVLSRGDLSCA